jgi:hypothetical protein
MPFISARKILGVAQESVQNTAVSLSSTDFIEAYDFEGGPETEILEMNPYRSTLDRVKHVTGKQWAPFKFAVDLKGSGTAGTDYAPLSAILEGAAFVKTVAATQSVQSVTVTGGGTGYTSASVLSFSGGGGSGAAGYPIIVGGVIVAIIMTNPGSGYTSDPTPAVSVGSGATFTVTRGGTVLFAPTSAAASSNFAGPGKSFTLKVYEEGDGILKVFNGCLADIKFNLDAGKIGKAEVTGMGMYTAVADSASFPSNSPNSTAPPKFASAGLYAHDVQAEIAKLEFGLNNEISERPSANAASSLAGFQITGRNPAGSFDPMAVKVATHDYIGRYMAGSEAAIAFQLGTTAGNRIFFSFPKTQYGKVSSADRNKMLAFQVPFMMNRNTGDDYGTLIFA